MRALVGCDFSSATSKQKTSVLAWGESSGSAVRLKRSHAQRDALVDDASGDLLDATLCLLQTAWGYRQNLAGAAQFGLPLHRDPLEGWIVSA
jgi:hypothetical protein